MSRLPSENTPRGDGVRSVRHQSALGWWQMSFAAPHPSLSSFVRRYCGWEEETAAPLWRLEPPGLELPLIILFESPVLARENEERSEVERFGSFVAGLYDRHTLVGSSGPMAGIQVDFTPIGARLLLGRPLVAFTNKMVEIDDVWGARAAGLTSQLAEARSWRERFTLMDRFIGSCVAAARAPHRAVTWALEELVRSGGRARVDVLAREIGWSRRHFIHRMHQEFGLTPGSLGRVLRLGRAVRVLRTRGQVRLADVAAACGYYDQAHFTRDFRQFTGMTPGAFVDNRLPDGGGVAAAR